MGDSTATVSPGCATARSARFSASMQPLRDQDVLRRERHARRAARAARAPARNWRWPLSGAATASMLGVAGAARASWRCAAPRRGRARGAPRAIARSSFVGAPRRRRATKSDTLVVDADVLRRVGRPSAAGSSMGAIEQAPRRGARNSRSAARASTQPSLSIARHSLQRGRQADAVQPHQRPHRGHARAGREHAGVDRAAVVQREALIERLRVARASPSSNDAGRAVARAGTVGGRLDHNRGEANVLIRCRCLAPCACSDR